MLLYPRAQKLPYTSPTLSVEGALSRGVVIVGRGAAPAGLGRREPGHSGGGGAPPGTTRSPCQELAETCLLRYRPSAYLSAIAPRPQAIMRQPRQSGPAADRRPQMSVRLECGELRRALKEREARSYLT